MTRVGLMYASLDGVTFDGGDPWALFTIWQDQIRGWFESVGVRRQDADRPLSHGAFASRAYRGGRLITVEGQINTRSPGEQESAMARMTGILADGQLGDLAVTTTEGTSSALVQLNAAPEIRVVTYGRVANYSLELWAPDPRRYGERRVWSGRSVEPWHRGNTDAHPVCTVMGAASNGYTISYRGHAFRVSGSKSASSVDVIDMRTGWVRRDGRVLTGVVSAADVFTVPRGAVAGPVTITGGPSMEVALRDTYI
ncbi:hypothetical protein [Microbacterium sp. gxy059]|uniref:hypothetical protein n=1 Tax=Microbacterium sp. gxy059 TaxID=2957199 RepID=UPI003D98CF31